MDPHAARLPRPPHLRTICSISAGLPARAFFGLLADAGVTAALDTRVNRAYRGQGFGTREDDFRLLCELTEVAYEIVPAFMPTREMRVEFARVFTDVRRAADRDPDAWTAYLEAYEALLKARRPFQDDQVHRLLYGEHEAIAIVCACRHHDDCHRSYTCGALARFLPDVSVRRLYPEGKRPPRASPRRYLRRDLPLAGLTADPPRGR